MDMRRSPRRFRELAERYLRASGSAPDREIAAALSLSAAEFLALADRHAGPSGNRG